MYSSAQLSYRGKNIWSEEEDVPESPQKVKKLLK